VTLTIQPLSPGPSFTQARRAYNALQIPYRDLSSPTGSFVDLPAVFSGNRVSRCRETCGHGSLANQNPEPRWVKGQRFLVRRGFPYREIGTSDVAVHMYHEFPNPELRWHVRYPPRYVIFSLSSLSGISYRESRDRDFTVHNFLMHSSTRIPMKL
jgi:hypothetical protein